MNLDTKLKNASQRVIYNFAKLIGTSTFRTLISKDYDTDTGVVTPVYVDPNLDLFIAFDNIDENQESISKSTVEDPNVLEVTRICFIAGIDVTADPKEGDLVIAADDGKSYEVVDVSTDMYRALFTCELSLII